MTRLAAEQLTVAFGAQVAVDAVSLAVGPGELVGLIGPNSAGKSTLLRALASLIAPASGRVTIDGRPAATVPRRARARAIGYLPQGGRSEWAVPVEELVLMGRSAYLGVIRGASAADREIARRAMAETDVAHLAARPATALSGGETARVLLARALAGEPDLLLADEPVAGLDPYHRLEVMERLAALADRGAGIVAVLHDLTLAARYCDRLVLMHEGRLVSDGEAGEALSDGLLAQVYRIRALRGTAGTQEYLVPWTRLAD